MAGFLGAFGAAMKKTGSAMKKGGSAVKKAYRKGGEGLSTKQKTANAISGGLQSLGGKAPDIPYKKPSSPASSSESRRGLFGFGKRKNRFAKEVED